MGAGFGGDGGTSVDGERHAVTTMAPGTADHGLPPAVADLADEWDDLVDRSPDPLPWARPGWVGAWWRAFGRGNLVVLSARRGDRLAAVVPLARRWGGLTSPTNYHTPGFDLVGEDEAAVHDLADALFDERPSWVRTRFVPGGGVTAAALRTTAAAHGYGHAERTLERSPCIDTAIGWAAYQAGLDAKLRRELRRRRRRLDGQGHVEVTVDDGRRDLDERLAEGFAVEARGWKGDAGTAIASSPSTERFYREVARWAAGRGMLRLAFLRLDGRPLAFDFALEDHDRHYLLKCGYDPDYRRSAPGLLLRFAMVERAFRSGLRRYEFLGTDEPWKLAWARTIEDRDELSFFRRSPMGLAARAVASGRPAAARALALARR
jgi:CelD/BcsL family acetyltransferase involved in cellulose biosynthesis